jgi:hypothetical protein
VADREVERVWVLLLTHRSVNVLSWPISFGWSERVAEDAFAGNRRRFEEARAQLVVIPLELRATAESGCDAQLASA